MFGDEFVDPLKMLYFIENKIIDRMALLSETHLHTKWALSRVGDNTSTQEGKEKSTKAENCLKHWREREQNQLKITKI